MLKTRLRAKPFCNEFHFFLFAVILLLVSIYQPIFLIVLFIYLVFIIKKTKFFIPICVVLICVFLSYSFKKMSLHELKAGEYEGIYEVVDVKKNEIVLKKDTKIIIFSEESGLIPGDMIYAKIKIYQLEKSSFSGDFNAQAYYFAKGITNRGRFIQFDKIGSKWNIARVKYTILKNYESYLKPKSLIYIKTLVFGITELDKEVKQAYSILYLSHILVISGMHITLIYNLFLFQKFFKIKGEKLTIFILSIYVLFIGCPMSCLRAYLFLILEMWNKKGELKYTKLDILSISFIGMTFFFPLKAFQTSFILSYIISFVLIFMREYNPFKGKIKKAFFSSVICIFSVLPFLINQTNEVSFVGIFLSFILGYLFSKILFPLTLLMILFPCGAYEGVFQGLDHVLLFLKKYTFPVSIPYISTLGIIIYYVIFISVLFSLSKNVKRYRIAYILVYLFVLCFFQKLNPFYKVTFIDVGQGDSILIELPYQKGNVLIDSYGKTVKYLKSIGLRKLDYVVLTHFDKDHIGGIEDTVKEFEIGKILYSKYEEISKIKKIKEEKVPIGSEDVFQLGEISFYVLGPILDLSNANANSIVLKFSINGYDFLLTGDMTVDAEKALVLKYGKALDSDILKVGHHGSKTSSSNDFLNMVTPKYSIISVGENNMYGLPDNEVIERLNNYSKVYLTKNCGNIQMIIRKTLKIRKYRN